MLLVHALPPLTTTTAAACRRLQPPATTTTKSCRHRHQVALGQQVRSRCVGGCGCRPTSASRVCQVAFGSLNSGVICCPCRESGPTETPMALLCRHSLLLLAQRNSDGTRQRQEWHLLLARRHDNRRKPLTSCNGYAAEERYAPALHIHRHGVLAWTTPVRTRVRSLPFGTIGLGTHSS